MQRMTLRIIMTTLLMLAGTQSTYSMERMARLGVGMTNQLKNDVTALSFKIQRSKSFAIGGIVGYDSNDTDGGHGFGLKLYRNLFEEPLLNFYGAFTAAIINKKSTTADQSGFEFDLSLGSEFSFSGLESLGLSFEFGVSVNKLDDFVIQTTGSQFIVTSIHFYL
jgi:hypothetical protein